MKTTLAELDGLLGSAPFRLLQITEADATHKPDPDRWSKKEILGHLIDSAANNHQRFVRGQLTARLEIPGYEQERWVTSQTYSEESWTELIDLWTAFNRHILHVLRAIPESDLFHEVVVGENPPATLAWLAVDYVRHLKHHLGQILD